MNSVSLSGNLGKDPELKSTRSGSSILNMLLAVNDRVKQGEEWVDYTNWVNVVVFGKRAESLSNILRKGTKIAVQGKLRYSSWEKDGVKRSKIEVIADDIDIMQRNGSQGQQNDSQGGYVNGQGNYPQQQYPQQQGAPQYPQQGYQQQGFQPDVYDSDCPF